MMKATMFLFALLLLTGAVSAQQKAGDSLQLVKDYLLEIKAAIPAKSNEVNSKMHAMQGLIRKQTQYQVMLQNQLTKILADNVTLRKEVQQQFDSVVQSAALLRSDLQQLPLGDSSVQGEILFLKKNVPLIVEKISEYIRKAVSAP